MWGVYVGTLCVGTYATREYADQVAQWYADDYVGVSVLHSR
jgi:hypothetical protein